MDTHSSETQVHAHKSPNYFAVFIFLGLVTAIMAGIELFDAPIGATLKHSLYLILSVIKATLVAMYYMHLKFDSRVYTILFTMPVALVLVLIIILLI